MSEIDTILARLEAEGGALYGDEAVTQLQHALQCATMAHGEDRPAALVAAALLHDYGHILLKDQGAAARGIDRRHEVAAARHLETLFGPEVTGPIRLHVAAKRYLCAVDPAYHDGLSFASRRSLRVQGGPFDRLDRLRFESEPAWREAVALRRWDDLAKNPAAATPPLAHFRPFLAALVR